MASAAVVEALGAGVEMEAVGFSVAAGVVQQARVRTKFLELAELGLWFCVSVAPTSQTPALS